MRRPGRLSNSALGWRILSGLCFVDMLVSRLGVARLAALATFVFFVGAIGTRPLVSLHGATMGVGPGELGILVALFSLVPVLFTTTFGRWLDKHGCIPAMLFSILLASVGLMLPVLMADRIGLYTSQVVAGSGFTAFVLATQKYVGQSSTSLWDRERNIAIFAMGVALGSLFGPLVAGFVGDVAGFLIAFAVLSVCSLCALVVLVPLWLHERSVAPVLPVKPAGAGVGGSGGMLRVLGYNPYLGRAFLISVLVLMGKDMYIAYFPLYGLEAGLSATAIGAIIALHNAGGVVMRFFMLPLVRLIGKNNLVIWSTVISGLFFVLIPVSGEVWVLSAVSLIIGLGLGLGQPLAITTTMNLAPKDKVGEVLGFRLMLNRVTQFAAPLGFAGAAVAAGVAGVFVIIGGAMLLGATRLRIPPDAEAQAQQTPGSTADARG